ncbi:class 3 fructose-bisphosphatase [Bombilactobacillus bombi]|uniref:Fructose-1,6-bisphosphatase class 3 n=1 Tax=Bombilactobacillus bombi TaxID=1303590 RepID=A0A417ZED4_9LACO|nr:fructose-1,6-bisphosphatase [Bombilactobacillus bombi]RHW49583.1 class 3 fructose-bisphosphatase [Bombilactobacillus bombi]
MTQELTKKLLQEKFPTREAITTEIINLQAILNLPKSTEAFMSDIHGEFAAFDHVLRNASGNIKIKIEDLFNGRLTSKNQQELAFLVYYPSQRLKIIKKNFAQAEDLRQWYLDTFAQLLELLKYCSTKYTRSKVRKALAPEFVYITEELLYGDFASTDKQNYYAQITTDIINLKSADQFIIALCHTIQRLVVDHLHVVGDIYDRGPHPDKIMDRLMKHHSVDLQWGNHDILWLGAAAGSPLCVANLLRICARYNNLAIVEDAYGINLRHLSLLAEKYYQDNPCFAPKLNPQEPKPSNAELSQINKIHQAIAIIQFKLEGQAIDRRPEFKMQDRKMLEKLDKHQQKITLNGQSYPIVHGCFQTVDYQHPYQLLPQEQTVITQLTQAFVHSDKLRRHMDFFMQKGSMYLVYNNNLLVHGCVPVDEQGNFEGLTINHHLYCGKELFDLLEDNLRSSYADSHQSTDLATDLLWYLWTGPVSPLFGKRAMTTFERYFIADANTHFEKPNSYYQLRHQSQFITKVLHEFGITDKTGHLINGHTPVKKGHSPIMADGKMLVIDGGFAEAYHQTTGIGGYTLLYNSYGLQLVTHQPFTTREQAIKQLSDIVSTKRVVEQEVARKTVAETDIGKQLKQQIQQLEELLATE